MKKNEIDLSHVEKSLKPIPIEIINEIIQESIDQIRKTNPLEINQTVVNNIATAHIFCSDKSAEDVLKELNKFISENLSNILESKTGESSKNYHRTITLFESSINDKMLAISWRKR